ncbi:uncharacterized protein LOC111377326 [Olea europaea var. sylvestris]|nr:uncharacterized protein LOC111377326 [Olea europaea var. sylvestris]
MADVLVQFQLYVIKYWLLFLLMIYTSLQREHDHHYVAEASCFLFLYNCSVFLKRGSKNSAKGLTEMGITGELVRTAFSQSLSVRMRDSHARSYAVEKKRWSSVRSYLCGDEFSSIVAEDDLSSFKPAIDEGEFTSVYAEADRASIRSSQATVNQPLGGDSRTKQMLKAMR